MKTRPADSRYEWREPRGQVRGEQGGRDHCEVVPSFSMSIQVLKLAVIWRLSTSQSQVEFHDVIV